MSGQEIEGKIAEFLIVGKQDIGVKLPDRLGGFTNDSGFVYRCKFIIALLVRSLPSRVLPVHGTDPLPAGIWQ